MSVGLQHIKLPVLITLGLLLQLTVFGQEPSKKVISDGVDLYKKGNYSAAEKKFTEGTKNKAYQNVSAYNRGNALYKLKKYKESSEQFLNAAKEEKTKELRAKALHNLGNSFLQEKDYENALKAYQHSLINNPSDEKTRYNLAYTMQMLKKQQQQKDKNKQKQDQQQQQQDQKDQKDKKDDQKQQQKQQQQQQQQDLNKQNAQNMLDALNQDEKNIQKKVKGNKSNGQKKPVEKDW